MKTITVYFSDGTSAKFHEDKSLQSVKFITDEEHNRKNKFPSQSEVFTLYSHTHDGLFPSFLEVLANSDYFFDIEEPDVYYNPSAIVRIEK